MAARPTVLGRRNVLRLCLNESRRFIFEEKNSSKQIS